MEIPVPDVCTLYKWSFLLTYNNAQSVNTDVVSWHFINT